MGVKRPLILRQIVQDLPPCIDLKLNLSAFDVHGFISLSLSENNASQQSVDHETETVSDKSSL